MYEARLWPFLAIGLRLRQARRNEHAVGVGDAIAVGSALPLAYIEALLPVVVVGFRIVVERDAVASWGSARGRAGADTGSLALSHRGLHRLIRAVRGRGGQRGCAGRASAQRVVRSRDGTEAATAPSRRGPSFRLGLRLWLDEDLLDADGGRRRLQF